MWADYFDSQNVRYAFFSAANAAALQELRRATEAAKEAIVNKNGGHQSDHEHEEIDSDDTSSDGQLSEEDSFDNRHFFRAIEEDAVDGHDARTKILSVLELEDLFLEVAPDLSSEAIVPGHTCHLTSI